jgi:C1A family cysteine protease
MKKVHYVPGVSKSKIGLKSESQLPSKYDSRNESWAKNIKVKDQDISGMCWAFSISTAAEYSYSKEKNLTSGDFKTLSPGHLAWFFYNRVNDPLRLTAGDKNYQERGYIWAEGGDQIEGMQHLATWSGLTTEKKAPLQNVMNHLYEDGWYLIWDGVIPYNNNIAYKTDSTAGSFLNLEECIMYPSPDGASKETIKNLVYKYGAVSTSVEFDTDKYMNNNKYFYNYSEVNDMDHAVTIIGWNDGISKSNFKINGKQPSKNGAWIVQNSWGTGEHDKGIFYLSYESCGQSNDNGKKADQYSDISAYNMMPANTYKYNFQYDGTGDWFGTFDEGNENFITGSGTKAANVYTNRTGRPILIKAVGFTTFNVGSTPYTIDVYTSLKNPKNPASGFYKGRTKYTTTTPGAKTAVLSKPVYVGAGRSFAIVFSFGKGTDFGVEKQFTYRFDVATSPGQSFFRRSSSSAWKDIHYDANGPACFRIKGFANPTSAQFSEEASYAKAIKVRINKIKKKKRKATVVFTTSERGAAYQIKYGKKKSLKKKTKTRTVKATKKNPIKVTLKKLKKGKRYYVKVRAFRKIKNPKTGKYVKVYGAWSKTVKFKAK